MNNVKGIESNKLNKFREAKEEIQKILADLKIYLNECHTFLLAVKAEGKQFESVFPEELFKNSELNLSKVDSIIEITLRNQMKVAFFGRTSNGKSSVINALLGYRLVPTGIGHTTACFIQVQGTYKDQAYLELPKSSSASNGSILNIESIRDIAHSMVESQNRLSVDSLVKIYWPSKLCMLLREEVTLLDSPGVDVDPDLDKWIDKFCLDADVFVLVANSESTLMQAEKKFFHKVSERISKPNILILNNRWDASANESELIDEVRQQHTKRCTEFLANELGVCSVEEAKSHVFFVSAKEVIKKRQQRGSIQMDFQTGDKLNASFDSYTSTNQGDFSEFWEERYKEFENFETQFQTILSESAVKTKFSTHVDQARQILSQLKSGIELTYQNCNNEKLSAQRGCAINTRQLDLLRSELSGALNLVDEALVNCLSNVEQNVYENLHEEVFQLDNLVNTFSATFYPDRDLRAIYKKELNEFVEKKLGQRLEIDCTESIIEEVERLQKYILDLFLKFQTDDAHKKSLNEFNANSNFKPHFRIDCRNICLDFQEDINFRFSWGFENIINRIKSLANRYPNSDKSKTVPQSYRQPTSSMMDEFNSGTFLSMITPIFPSLVGRNSLAAVVGIGMIFRATGWKVIGVCLTIYGGLWFYEWSTWTTKAMERSFKRQYTDYISNKLKMIVGQTSINISYQVKLEINNYKERLQTIIMNYHNLVKEEVNQLQIDIKKLSEIEVRAKKLRDDSVTIDALLMGFQKAFINYSISSR